MGAIWNGGQYWQKSHFQIEPKVCSRSTPMADALPIDLLLCCRVSSATTGYDIVWLISGDPAKVQGHFDTSAQVSA